MDPTQLSVELHNPQSWNRYSYALNRPLRYVDPNGKWPKGVHYSIIDAAFDFLSGSDRLVLKDASNYADRVRNQGRKGAKDHAMSVPGQNHVSAAQATEEYIRSKVLSAAQKQAAWELVGGSGYNDAALFDLGLAIHARTDQFAPQHEGQQEWGGVFGDPIGAAAHVMLEFFTRWLEDEAKERARIHALLLWKQFKEEVEKQKEEECKRNPYACPPPPKPEKTK